MIPDISMTADAAAFIKAAMSMAKRKALGVRLGVKKAGCSGYEYVVEYVYDLQVHDHAYEYMGATVIVDEVALEKFLKGTVVDYRKEGLNKGLVFDNPNVEAQCGCGESFALKGGK